MNSLEERQKILVVDDSKFNQELIMEILGEEYQYVLANDGLEAISILQKRLDNRFNVVGYQYAENEWV